MNKIYTYRKLLGGCMDPHQAFLLERGLKTLKPRMKCHNENALFVANYLNNIDKIKNVIYPGLESHPQHDLAQIQFDGFGGMVSFDLGTSGWAVKFADALKVIKNAVSLGGTESLVSLPIWTSHYGVESAALKKAGVTPGMVRLSVGLEDLSDLIADLDQALKKTFRKR
jgi:cystathionine beta-lyase/cystathionine gamma-synthase